MPIKQLSKGRMFLMLAALFLSSMCTLGDMVVTPIVANLYVTFADAPEWLINLGITGPAIAGLPFCFLGGWLADRMDKKTLMVVGFAIFTVTAIFGAAITNIYYFVAMRLCATGVAWGITNSAALAILADVFEDEDEHGKMVGYYNTVMSLIGAALALVAGILGVEVWQNAFNTYWIAVPVLIMLIAFVPKCPPKKDAAQQKNDAETGAVPAGWWKKLLPLNIQIFIIAICYFVALYMLSLYVTDAGIGDAALTGSLASVMTICSAIGSAFFGMFYKKMKNAVYLPAVLIIGVCFFAQAFIPTMAVAFITIALMGFCWPFYFCYFYTYCTEIVPVTKQGTATGIVALSDGLAAALCSYLLTGLMGATGAASSLSVWPIFGVVLVVVDIISAVWFVSTRKKAAAAPESK